jgi:hypothetical protein
MPSPKVMRICYYLLLLLHAPNMVRALRDPEMWRFLAVAIVVVALAVAVGSVAAVALAAVRRSSDRSNDGTPSLNLRYC